MEITWKPKGSEMKGQISKAFTIYNLLFCVCILSFFFFTCLFLFYFYFFFSLASGATLITFYSFAVIGAVVAFLLNHRLQHCKAYSFGGGMKAIFNCSWEAGQYY